MASCPVLLCCGISPMWLLSSSFHCVRLGDVVQLPAWVSLWRLPPPARLLEVPRCVSLAGELAGAGFILWSPGPGIGRCSMAFIQLMGGGLGQQAPSCQTGLSAPSKINLPPPPRQGWGGNSHKSESAPVTLPRGKTDRKSHQGERQVEAEF